ncbi:helix-turn-helix domain-containing protein [Aquimarina longa]|uniref:helix-turn-helix domain-containing protein n=1 Tax=Aquimarina longa TaxID=1080221 RepID=UPI0007844F15|nr:helix-turn-helix transcriptional regulator [Aquimarina longa]
MINFHPTNDFYFLYAYLKSIILISFLVVLVVFATKHISLKKKTNKREVIDSKPIQQLPNLHIVIDNSFVTELNEFIYKNVDNEKLNVAFLADNFSMTQRTFLRKVKKETGLTVVSYLKHIRLQYASDLLIKSDYSITEIMNKVMYNNLSYFSSEFKKKYSVSPRKYREKFRKFNCVPL